MVIYSKKVNANTDLHNLTLKNRSNVNFYIIDFPELLYQKHKVMEKLLKYESTNDIYSSLAVSHFIKYKWLTYGKV